MKSNNIVYFYFALCSIFLFSCGGGNNSTEKEEDYNKKIETALSQNNFVEAYSLVKLASSNGQKVIYTNEDVTKAELQNVMIEKDGEDAYKRVLFILTDNNLSDNLSIYKYLVNLAEVSGDKVLENKLRDKVTEIYEIDFDEKWEGLLPENYMTLDKEIQTILDNKKIKDKYKAIKEVLIKWKKNENPQKYEYILRLAQNNNDKVLEQKIRKEALDLYKKECTSDNESDRISNSKNSSWLSLLPADFDVDKFQKSLTTEGQIQSIIEGKSGNKYKAIKDIMIKNNINENFSTYKYVIEICHANNQTTLENKFREDVVALYKEDCNVEDEELREARSKNSVWIPLLPSKFNLEEFQRKNRKKLWGIF